MGIYRSISDLPLPELVQGLKSSDPTLPLVSAAALGRLGEEATEAVPALAEAVKSGNVYLRRVAVLALSDIGTQARSAIPVLQAALHDEDEWVRQRAAVAIAAVESEARTPGPEEASSDTEESDRDADEPVLAVITAGGQATESPRGKRKARRSKQGRTLEEESPPPAVTAEPDGGGAPPEVDPLPEGDGPAEMVGETATGSLSPHQGDGPAEPCADPAG